MDVIDRACDLEQFHRDKAIDAARKNANKPSRLDCLDCENEIPKARRDVGGIDRCITCQTLLEK